MFADSEFSGNRNLKISSDEDRIGEAQEKYPNLRRGNPGNSGRPKGVPSAPGVLSDFRHVYTCAASEDTTENQKNMRVYLRERPMDFMRQMVQLEIQHRNKAKKSEAQGAAQAVLVGPVVEGSKEAREEFEDEGQGRMEDWLKRVREDYDHERAGAVDVPLSDTGIAGGGDGVVPGASGAHEAV